jgi:3-hydroxyisobutyrate dehydrogenase-like beta-hydroxyacid dehydrogenase
MDKVAFLGTGLLGSGMVERMLAQGDSVVVWNRTTAKARSLEPLGAHVAATPEQAAQGASRVHIALPDDGVVDAVVAAIAPHLGPRTLVIDHSTTSPAGTAARHARLAGAGVRFLHAPVFMSPQMCREGTGLMMVSGPAPLFEQAQPSLARMTGDVWFVGERPDLAACYKLFGNSMIFVINAGLADILGMATTLGVPALDAVGVFSRFKAGNAIGMRGDKMARGDFSAMFELAMARKDLRLMIEAAGSAPLAVLPAIAVRMDDAIARGHGKDDLVAIATT